MKFSEQWLRQWVNPPVTTQELASQLTMLGLEVDCITPVAGEFSQVIIGKVVTVKSHPNAKKLSICEVNTGAKELLTIVCGAANVKPQCNVAVATLGAKIANNNIELVAIREVESQGMLCSAAELGLAETSEGIMLLANDAPIGEDLRQYLKLDDHIIDIDLTPNRGDCFCVLGIAREVATRNAMHYTPPASKPVTPTSTQSQAVKVTAVQGCPRYVGRCISNINNQATTPIWMQERLRRSHIRCIHPVVDVTNYVMLELGQPMHGFDADNINGVITVRNAHAGEILMLLDGQELTLDENCLVIADDKHVLALAGIMGGLGSGVTATTTNIFLESAFFDPQQIGSRARHFGLQTDSSQRFERGVDYELQLQALERATELLVDIVGGDVGPIVEVSNSETLPKQTTIQLTSANVERVLGTALSDDFIMTTLSHLGITIDKVESGWQATVPSYRFDLQREEDLIEELARIYGYDQLPQTLPQLSVSLQPQPSDQLSLTNIRNLLAARGFHEVISYSFVAEELQKLLDPNSELLRLTNPISADLAVMRTSLWPGLLTTVQYNQRRQQDHMRLFEIGLSFKQNDGELTQERMLAGVIAGNYAPLQWAQTTRTVDLYDLKGDLEALFALTGNTKHFSFKQANHQALHPGQTAEIIFQDKKIGYIGALHPAILQQLDLSGPLFLFELSLAKLNHAVKLPTYQELIKFPMIRRDISITVSSQINYQQILHNIKSINSDLLKGIEIFDVYHGKEVESKDISVAIRLTFQHPSRTLTDGEVTKQLEQIVTSLQDGIGAILRE